MSLQAAMIPCCGQFPEIAEIVFYEAHDVPQIRGLLDQAPRDAEKPLMDEANT